jgi:hypothetical protein
MLTRGVPCLTEGSSWHVLFLTGTFEGQLNSALQPAIEKVRCEGEHGAGEDSVSGTTNCGSCRQGQQAGGPWLCVPLRHWFGTEIYDSCHDIRVTQELLGHSNPATTAGYIAYSHVDAAAVGSLKIEA